MAKKSDTQLNVSELRELLRYYIGNPLPYMQDARYRDLLDRFNATDDRPVAEDPRVPQGQLPEA